MKNSNQRGFTLIELMIVVVIVAILAAIAYPSYTEFVRRSNRADAKTALLENAQFLERNFTVANRYSTDSAGNDIALPITQAPREGDAKYDITVSFPTASQFLLEAEPVGTASGDHCGTFTLNNVGVKEVTGGTRTAAECWGK
jgi:type IV pilus assembly protein PilE